MSPLAEVTRYLVEDLPLSDFPSVRPIRFNAYRECGGYEALTRARDLSPDAVLGEVLRANLRGRGGAGFPTGKKWEFVSARSGVKYLCCNAAEDEPGTFKDRYILKRNPHLLIEGTILSAYAVGASVAYLYINGTFADELVLMEEALDESRSAGLWGEGSPFPVELKIAKSPGTYVAGEETALLEVIEGRAAAPRQKPPYYPAVRGLFGAPTVVNNAETLCHVPFIVRNGAEWFRAIGSSDSPGTMIFTLTGDVRRPGLYELPLGVPLRSLIEERGGGVKNGRVKAVFPGGPSNSLVTDRDLDVPLDFESLKRIGSGLGTGAVIVMDETACIVEETEKYARFFAKESCGQCPPCTLGTAHLADLLKKIEEGGGTQKDVDLVGQVSGMIKGRGYCYLLTGAALAVESAFVNFQEEFVAHVKEGRCVVKN